MNLSFTILKIIVYPLSIVKLKNLFYLKRFPNRVKSSLNVFCSFHQDLAVSLRDLVDFQVGITLTEEVHFVQLFARKFQAQLFSRIINFYLIEIINVIIDHCYFVILGVEFFQQKKYYHLKFIKITAKLPTVISI